VRALALYTFLGADILGSDAPKIPFRPLLEIPVSFEPGRYTVEARWEALESLPSGKPLAQPVVVGPAQITL
jgi:hypothetical protein